MKMTIDKFQKQFYIERVAANMRRTTQDDWSSFDMANLCKIAGLWEEWLDAENRGEEEALTLRAANILGLKLNNKPSGAIDSHRKKEQMTGKEYDIDEEQFAELDAFLEWLREKKEEYFSVPRIRLINQKRLNEFEYAYFKISKIIKKISPDAVIEHTLNDDWDIGVGAITIETDELSTTNIIEFINAVKFASDFEVFPLLNGNIKIILGFRGMLDDITPQT